MTESDLIALVKSGDHGAFADLIGPHKVILWGLALQRLGTKEAAEDAMQDAMFKAWRGLPAYQEGNFRSWLLRIVSNTCYDHLRRSRVRATLSLDELADAAEDSDGEGFGFMADGAPDLADCVITAEEIAPVYATIEALPDWQRSTLLLVDVHGYNYEEAAAIQEVPLGTVKSRLSRARVAVRNSLFGKGQ